MNLLQKKTYQGFTHYVRADIYLDHEIMERKTEDRTRNQITLEPQ